MEFGRGDRVRLITGGPEMAVESVADDVVAALWFVGDKLNSRSFPAAVLEPAAGLTDEEAGARLLSILAGAAAERDDG